MEVKGKSMENELSYLLWNSCAAVPHSLPSRFTRPGGYRCDKTLVGIAVFLASEAVAKGRIQFGKHNLRRFRHTVEIRANAQYQLGVRRSVFVQNHRNEHSLQEIRKPCFMRFIMCDPSIRDIAVERGKARGP